MKNKFLSVASYSAKVLFMAFALTTLAKTISAQSVLDSDSLITDFRLFIQYLEETHPDPYSGFGGKVFFHKQAADIEEQINKNQYSKSDFAEVLTSFVSNLQDGHTFLYNRIDFSKGKFVPFKFRVINDGIIVSSVSPNYSGLLGYKLDSVNGISVENLLGRLSKYYGFENEYDKFSTLIDCIDNSVSLEKFGYTIEGYKMRYSMHSPDGKVVNLSIPMISLDSLDNVKEVRSPSHGNYPNEYLFNCFADDVKSTMLFSVKSVMARENFEYMFQNGWDMYGQLASFYKYTLKKEMPSDTLKAISMLPSFSEEFAKMLQEMKKHKAKNLIIDLRGNNGGWTPITMPTLYMLYGDKALGITDDCHFYRLISPLYMQKINSTLEAFNKENGTNYKFGDYMFEKDTKTETLSLDEQRKVFIENSMCDTKDILLKQNGNPIYSPQNVYVITDVFTFSAAFHYAFYLWKLGAKIIGVPSSQAPNTFMEVTPFQLPYSKLNGSISNSMQVFLPKDDYRAKILFPDIMLKYEDYKKYNFDLNSEILYLLDMNSK